MSSRLHQVTLLDNSGQVADSLQPRIVVYRSALSNETEQGFALLRSSYRNRLLAVDDDLIGRDDPEDVRDLLVDVMDFGDAAALHRFLQAGVAGGQDAED